MNHALGFRQTLLSLAMAAVCGALALPGQAAIVTLGEVNPNPVPPVVAGTLTIGINVAGEVRATAGSAITTDQLIIGRNPTADGTLRASGAGTQVNVTWVGGGLLQVGSQGRGLLDLRDQATLTFNPSLVACASSCGVVVSNGAGSNGTLSLSDAGTRFSSTGYLTVGQASLFRQPLDGFDGGVVGGQSTGTMTIVNGARLDSASISIASRGSGLARTNAEGATGMVLVDGAGSQLNLTRGEVGAGARSIIFMSSNNSPTSVNIARSTLDVRNGGRVKVDGSFAPDELSGLNAGFNGGQGSESTVNVTGAGSQLLFTGGVGFFNIGTHAVGQSTISGGGQVTGGSANGLAFASVGRDGGNASLTISGDDAAGNASLLRLSGRNPRNDGGAFLAVGRSAGDAAPAGAGVVNLSAGGRMEIDTAALTLTNPNGQTGMYIGAFAGSTGTLNIDGRSALTGAASMLSITAGSGLAPYIGVGRDGAAGSLNISGGGKMVVDSSHVSVPNAGGYLQGDAMLLEIGLRTGAAAGATATTGAVTVSGVGSELAMTGSVDRALTIGSGGNASGSLNILDGGTVRSLFALVGTGAGGSGALNMNAGHLVLDGVRNGGPGANTGAGITVGRLGGAGTAHIANGSTITISSTAPRAFFTVGGSGIAPGGTGTISISGGSHVSVSGPEARINVGGVGTAALQGVGTVSLSGAGTQLSANGVGAKVQVGSFDNTIGTLVVGAGATLSTSGLIGVGHDGLVSGGGAGVLIVNGVASAASLHVGSNGFLAGAGTVNANVINHGLINPGNSPGRLTLNGDFDNSDGKIVLEVKMLPNGSFIVDELVFGHGAQVAMGAGRIEFSFLDDTDPTAFFATGDFSLDSFFKETDASGAVIDLQAANLAWFSAAAFDARADHYQFDSFHFDPVLGASFQATHIPLPSSWLLVLVALWALWGARRGLSAINHRRSSGLAPRVAGIGWVRGFPRPV